MRRRSEARPSHIQDRRLGQAYNGREQSTPGTRIFRPNVNNDDASSDNVKVAKTEPSFGTDKGRPDVTTSRPEARVVPDSQLSSTRPAEDTVSVSYKPAFAQQESSAKTEIDVESREARIAQFQAETEAAAERRREQKLRLSDRFATEEIELPADKRQESPNTNKSRASSIGRKFDFEMYEAEQALYGGGRKKKQKKNKKAAESAKQAISINEVMTVEQLARSMKLKVDDLIQKLEDEGFEGARHDHMLEAETSAMFAELYGFEAIIAQAAVQDLVAQPVPEDNSGLPSRPPIVTIMGHVDHGKTTILDWLRKSSVAAGEHGGITQHIGAFSVIMPGSERQITFLDTPGHEAFLDMRRRGANVTDIVVLVVAADDSVKPQTVEAIKHALEAKVQLIVAINKVDKHDADVERVKQDLIQHDVVVEDYGGDYQAIPVSGKTGQGMEQLEESIITLADVLDLRADQEGPVEGSIIESKVTNAGRVATILVRRGVLKVGDFIVAGPTWARVRTIRNDAGQLVKAAYPGDPVQVDGWRGDDPTAGLEVLEANNEQHAKDVVQMRQEKLESAQSAKDMTVINAARAQEAEARAKVLEWERENKVNQRRHENEGWVDSQNSAGPKLVPFVVKADVAGSVEAIVAAVSAIGNKEIQANIVHSGTGPLTESDIQILATTGETAYAISFNQPVDNMIANLAGVAKVGILDHNVIYKCTDDVKAKVSAELPPIITQRVLGEAEIGKVFDITVKREVIKIAGCKVTNGTISRSTKVRVIRGSDTVYTGELSSLKNLKKDVQEMRKGTECGVGFKDWEDMQEGDQVQCFEEKQEARTLY